VAALQLASATDRSAPKSQKFKKHFSTFSDLFEISENYFYQDAYLIRSFFVAKKMPFP
jgi:hypothetical protein